MSEHQRTAADYAAEIDRAVDLLKYNHTSAGVVFRVVLEVQKQILAFVAGSYVKLEEQSDQLENLMATANDLETTLATLKTRVDALIAKGKTPPVLTQDQLDAANAAGQSLIAEIDAANQPTTQPVTAADTTGGTPQPEPVPAPANPA